MCFVFSVGVHAHVFTSAMRYSDRITLVKAASAGQLLV